MLNELEEMIDNFMVRVVSEAKEVTAADMGLDHRAGHEFFVSDCLRYIFAKNRNVRTLDYYGGFEYVDSSCRNTIGEWTFYSADDQRVAEAIDHVLELEEV